MKKMTFALCFCNRGFMPGELIYGAREDMIKAVTDAGYDYIAMVGESLGNMYGYVFDGIYQSDDFNVYADGTMHLKPGIVDISEHAGEAVKPGFVKYKDLDGDGIITTEDRQIIGNGQPDWFGGITNSFQFYGVDFSFMFQFCVGNDVQRTENVQHPVKTRDAEQPCRSKGQVDCNQRIEPCAFSQGICSLRRIFKIHRGRLFPQTQEHHIGLYNS